MSGRDGSRFPTDVKRWLEELGVFSEKGDERHHNVSRAALQLAEILQERAVQLQTPQERRQQEELDRMIQLPQDKATLTQMTDQSFRSKSPDRVVDQMIHILDVQGVPRFFSPWDRTLLKGFQSFGEYLPGVAVPLVKEKMRKETANVILPAEEAMLRMHLQARRDEGLRMNVNFLGEAMLGEKESRRRLDRYLAALQMPEIECVSVKISTLYSQISSIARKASLKILADRLELLYRAAHREEFVRNDGSRVSKFVYLDMEEYRDMRMTSELFMTTLERPGMEHVRAGIALQAYLPDSYLVQQELTRWAQKRVEKGGSSITIRIVKGANMEMERVEASLRGWPQAPYRTKVETDANYKRMIEFGLSPISKGAISLGVASHNLFDLSYAIVLAIREGSLETIQFEMLEGMANHQRRALFEFCQNVLLYAPACRREEFIHAIGYLIRRLDENTGPDNFLRHAFRIRVGEDAWHRLAAGFCESHRMVTSIPSAPRRNQNRLEPTPMPEAPKQWHQLVNEPDTDFSLVHHSRWAEEILQQWIGKCDANATFIPVVIDGHEEEGGGGLYESLDPSRPGVVVARYRQASEKQLERALHAAHSDRQEWTTISPQDRCTILRRVAQEIREHRSDLMGAALADGGKTLLESDPEVSEAIDFVEFYASCALDLYSQAEIQARPKGTVVVISPWNFPIAIPCGGIAAALAAGNSVILKPASDTSLPAFLLCQCFWRAGVPKNALQFVPCSGRLAGEKLIGSKAVEAVILTGGTDTALRMLTIHPNLNLYAETGGKNGTIVSGLSDRDLAIKNILHSAFSHSGQKCSATSLLLLEDEIAEDHEFREQLIDAVSSLRVGSAWDLSNKMGPLIRPPEGALLRGLKELEHGESWEVMPSQVGDNPCLYTPGVKWNVQKDSFTHKTELFGPVLGVMRYRTLTQAIELVNSTGYGLTSGLESLDDREQAFWKERIRAGNLYINRPTTGAIVLRQPFGGMGMSVFGPGFKAGGPNYLVPFLRYDEAGDRPSPTLRPKLPNMLSLWEALHATNHREMLSVDCGLSDRHWTRLLACLLSYDAFARNEIREIHDHFRLIGQDNFRRYLPLRQVRVRLHASDSAWSVLARAAASVAVGCHTIVSRPAGVFEVLESTMETMTHTWGGAIEFVEESDQELLELVREKQVDRLRYAGPELVPQEIRRAAHDSHLYIADAPVTPHGRIELLWYVQEQTISFDYHRYGNLGVRASEPRSDTL